MKKFNLGALEKELNTPKRIREHKSNGLHQLCRIIDYYRIEQKMSMEDSLYCAKQKYRLLYD